MNQFRIYALGTDFDVDAYVARGDLEFEDVWHFGEQLPTTCVKADYKSGGCAHELGDGYKVPLPEQERIAERYLREHQDALLQLRAFPGVTTLNLGMVYPVDLRDGVVGVCMGPPPRLMHAALSAQVELTYYVELLKYDFEFDEGEPSPSE